MSRNSYAHVRDNHVHARKQVKNKRKKERKKDLTTKRIQLNMFNVKTFHKDFNDDYQEETTMAANKLTSTYFVSYKYAAPNGAMRSVQKIVKANDIVHARELATKSLSSEHEWYQIGKIIEAKNDNPQQQL